MSNPSIATKSELLELIADRQNDFQANNLELTPPWSQSRDDADWRHIRERERKITRQTNRLSKAKQEFDNDFYMSS